jgi:type II secretory pathway component PulM
MNREVNNLKAYINQQNNISIVQEDYNGEESVIVITPYQVDHLVQWLQELKEELSGAEDMD